MITKSGDSIHMRSFDLLSLEILSSRAYAAFPSKFGFKGILDLEKLNNKYYLFYFFEDPLLDYEDVFMHQIDTNTCELVGPRKKIYTL